jgi:hypothetical protein
MRSKSALTIAFLVLSSYAICPAQSTVVNRAALMQTRLVETTKGIGTAFAIEVDNREYWITAKHIFTGIEDGPPGVFPSKTVQANLLDPYGGDTAGPGKKWKTVTFTTIDPGKDIDILVLAPEHPLLGSFPPGSLKAGTEELNSSNRTPLLPIGGDCEFLGYPYGGGWNEKSPGWALNNGIKPSPQYGGKIKATMKNGTLTATLENGTQVPLTPVNGWLWLPFAKRCTLSGSMVQNDITIFVLDGINNLGLSGGPVLTGDGASQEVFAVVSGFHAEPLEVLPAPEHGQAYVSPIPPPPELPGQKSELGKREIVESNSGLILAYDIAPAVKAIRANPIGPLYPQANVNTVK